MSGVDPSIPDGALLMSANLQADAMPSCPRTERKARKDLRSSMVGQDGQAVGSRGTERMGVPCGGGPGSAVRPTRATNQKWWAETKKEGHGADPITWHGILEAFWSRGTGLVRRQGPVKHLPEASQVVENWVEVHDQADQLSNDLIRHYWVMYPPRTCKSMSSYFDLEL